MIWFHASQNRHKKLTLSIFPDKLANQTSHSFSAGLRWQIKWQIENRFGKSRTHNTKTPQHLNITKFTQHDITHVYHVKQATLPLTYPKQAVNL